MNILFVTPECAPWIKTGGLGDVSGALPAALHRLGHDARVLLPAYAALQPLLDAPVSVHALPSEGPWPEARLVQVPGAGFPLLLLDCPSLFVDPITGGGSPYGGAGDGADDAGVAKRFAFLSHVAARLCTEAQALDGWCGEVLHANDWPCGLAPAYLRRLQQHAPSATHRAASLFTVHNLAFQGSFDTALAPSLDVPHEWLGLDGALHWDRLCFLKAALKFSDAINAVSPTYAQEIQQPELGFGLDGVLRARTHDLHGILNGIDTHTWNPATDTLIARAYDATTLDRKAVNKEALQARLGLKADPKAMVFGVVSRLTAQKGLDLVVDNLPWLLARGAQLAVLGQGDAALETALRDAAAAHPQQVAMGVGFDESLAHLIEAGADAFLMPSRFEPCGLNQMYSQAYGTPPIVRATGGLADSVTDHDSAPGAGTGFSFADATANGLLQAMQRAHLAFRNRPTWMSIQRRGMTRRFGWERSAQLYVTLYGRLRGDGCPDRN